MSDYPDFDPSRPTLPEPYLMALGRVTYSWGLLEDIMSMAISKLMGIETYDTKSAAILTHMSWPQKMDALETLIDLLIDSYPHLRSFSALKPKLKKAQTGRNTFIHARWAYDEASGTVRVLKISSRGKLRFSHEPIEVSEIDAVFNDIGACSSELLKLILNK